MLECGVGVLPRGQRHVRQFLERADPRLAGLGLHEVEDLRLPLQQQVVVAEKHRPALPQATARPGLLGDAGPPNRFEDVLKGPVVQAPGPVPQEANEYPDKPRLIVPFNRTSYARLRQLIDFVNSR